MAGPSASDAAPPAASAVPATTSGSRGPRAPITRPVNGESTMTSAPTGSRLSPAVSAGMPRTSCRYWVVRNRNAPNPHSANTAITMAAPNGTLRNSGSSSSGSARRGSYARMPSTASAATATRPRMTGDVQPSRRDSMIA